MPPPSFDVIIVGGGIIGAACAAEATSRGLSVALVEADHIGGGATAAGMGHLVVMDDSEDQFALTHYSQKLWHEISEELPADCEFDACGTIWVATDEDEMAEIKRKNLFYQARGVPAEILDAQALREAEPNLRAGLAGGLRIPSDAVIYPPCAARHFVDSAAKRGARLFVGSPVIELNGTGAKLSDGTFISAGVAVNACGHWSPQLTAGINVKKRKGHLVITDRYPGLVRHQLVELGYLKSAHSSTADSVAFNVQPRRTGQVLVGSSRQFGVEGNCVDQPILAQMIDRATAFMPRLARLQAIRVWTGFRAATPDKLPLIGRSAEDKNLFLATGHEGLGITTSLATARILVDELLGRDSAITREPYSPSRAGSEAART